MTLRNIYLNDIKIKGLKIFWFQIIGIGKNKTKRYKK